jgi:hypothetical protein
MTMRCFFGLVRLYIGKIFARWVYPYTNARNDMTMRCVFGLVRLYRGKIFARWAYHNTNARNDMTMRCFFGLVRLYIGKIFARWVYPYTNARNDMTRRCFFGLVCKIFARWVYPYTNACFAFFGLVRLYRGKIFARWVYPYTNARNDMTRRCFFGLVRLYRGKIFARWVYKNTNARNQTPKSPIQRCSYGHEMPFGCQNEQSGFGDFGVCRDSHVAIVQTTSVDRHACARTLDALGEKPGRNAAVSQTARRWSFSRRLL